MIAASNPLSSAPKNRAEITPPINPAAKIVVFVKKVERHGFTKQYFLVKIVLGD